MMGASHVYHPSIKSDGLADGCSRCKEISEEPFAGLDENNLRLLVERTEAWMRDELFPRSDTERDAMRVMEKVLVQHRILKRVLGEETTGDRQHRYGDAASADNERGEAA